MYTIASIDRIRELKQEIVSLARLNEQYKAGSLRSDVALKANAWRGLRLLEIREELGTMKWADSHTHRAVGLAGGRSHTHFRARTQNPRPVNRQPAPSDSFLRK